MTPYKIGAIPKSSLHNHCTFCDGKDTALEMAFTALQLGITDFGMSCHARNVYEPKIGVGENEAQQYIDKIHQLKQSFKHNMNIYCGIEQDYYSPINFRDKLDYLIGSVHDIFDENTGKYYYVDGPESMFESCIDNVFGGDAMALVEHFYKLTCENAIKYKPDIIAHFDLVVKNNNNNKFFNEDSTKYKNMALDCINEIIQKTDSVFEINTGGIFREYRNNAYPDNFILKHLCKKNAKVTISSDAHSKDAIGFMYDKMVADMQKTGFDYVYIWHKGEFVKQPAGLH